MTTALTRGRRRTARVRAGAVLSLPVLAVCAASAQAEVGYGLDVAIGHSDNLSRTATDQQSETIASLGAVLDLNHKSSRLEAQIGARGQYLEYLDDTFDSEVIANIVADATLDIIEERLSWVASDTFGQVNTDQFTPAGPTNREHVNFFETGPDFIMPLGSRLDLALLGRYSKINYEESPLDTERRRGEASLRRQTSAASSVALVARLEDVESDENTDLLDYERREGVVRYELASSRTTFDVEAGYTELRPQAQSIIAVTGEKSDGLLARLSFARRVTDATTVGFEAGREYADASDLFRQLETGQPLDGGPSTQPVQAVASPFTNTYGTLRWEFERNRTGLDLRASLYKEQYESQPEFDRRRTEAAASARRRMSPTRTGRVTVFYSAQDFETLDRKFSDLTAQAALDWRLGRANYLSLQYQYFRRNDDVSSGDFSESQVWLRFGFFGGSGRDGAMPAIETGF